MFEDRIQDGMMKLALHEIPDRLARVCPRLRAAAWPLLKVSRALPKKFLDLKIFVCAKHARRITVDHCPVIWRHTHNDQTHSCRCTADLNSINGRRRLGLEAAGFNLVGDTTPI
jgi:hypothetical protein